MSKHTPGSWQVSRTNPSQVRIDGFLRLIADCTTLKASWHQENLANARLIAAAPGLLQCLEELLAVIHDRERDDATIAAVNAAEGLIAQVRGDA